MEVCILNDIALQDLIAEYLTANPKAVVGMETLSSQYYVDTLLQKVYGIFTIEGIPNTWDYDYLLSHLFIDGIVGITDTSVGVVPLKCGFCGKLNIYDRMTQLIFTIPALGNSFTRTIYKDAMYLHINGDFRGCMDLINKYSVLLAMCDASININLLNSRVAFIGEAANQSQAKVLQNLYTKISKGNPCVVYRNADSQHGMSWYWNNVKNTYIANDILVTKRRIMAEFLTEIGIKVSNTEKKERLISDEANSQTEEKNNAIYIWKKNLEDDIAIINKMFGLSLKLIVNDNGGGNDDVA
jgi:hypothetical protein